MRITNKHNKQSQRKLTLLLTLLTLFLLQVTAKEVDSFNLLLPTSYHQSKGHARQLVVTEGGCYSWDSTDHSIVSVKGFPSPKTPNCFSTGVVELTHEGKYPVSVYITTKDDKTNEITSIPVRIRDLQRIAIFTKSRMMNLKQIQNLEIYGFDSENNTFTSLEGLRFAWKIEDQNIEGGGGSIVKIPLKDSSLFMPLDTRKKMEREQGIESDLLVVEAKKVGKVVITAQCLEPNYEHVKDHITLIIQERFDIWPHLPQYLLAGSTFQYYLMTPSGHNITLPAMHYSISLSNPLFTCSRTLFIETPTSKHEQTFLEISDSRTSPKFSNMVEINSFQPDEIEITMDRDVIIVGKNHANFRIRFKHEGRVLKGIVDQNKVLLKIVDEYGNKINSFTIEGNKRMIGSVEQSAGFIEVEYQGLIARHKIRSITPLKILLPPSHLENKIYLPIGESYQLHAIGGSKSYKFTPSTSKITISSTGALVTQSEGIEVVTITDEKNPENTLEISVHISKINAIESLEEHKEFNVHEDGFLYLSAKVANTNSYYTECNDVLLKGVSFIPVSSQGNPPIQAISYYPANRDTIKQIKQLSSSNANFEKSLAKRYPSHPTPSENDLQKTYSIYLKANQIQMRDLLHIFSEESNNNHYGLCAKVIVKANLKYDGEIEVRKINLLEGGRIKVRVYPKLKTLYQSEDLRSRGILMTPHSMFKWESQGGSYPWAQNGSTNVYLNDVKLREGSWLGKRASPILSCGAESTELTFTLRYENSASPALPFPVRQTEQLKIICKKPHKILLSMTDRILTPPTSIVSLYPRQSFSVSLLALPFENSQDRYYNCSNVFFETANAKYGQVRLEKIGDQCSWRIDYENGERKFNDMIEDDQITINAYLKKEGDGAGKGILDESLKNTIQIKTIQPFILDSEGSNSEIVMARDAEAPKRITFTKESASAIQPGRIRLECSDQEMFTCQYNEVTKEIIVSPTPNGRSGRGVIRIVDKNVMGAPFTEIPVNIVSIEDIEVEVERADGDDGTWVFEGEEFYLKVRVSGLNSTSQESSLKRLIPISNIDINSVKVFTQCPSSPRRECSPPQQISRTYNEQTHQTVIKYRAPYLSPSEKLPLSLRVNAGKRNLISEADIVVYPVFSVSGADMLKVEDDSSMGQGDEAYKPVIYRESIQAMVAVMESCSHRISINGGPEHLQLDITSNPSEGHYYKIIKESPRSLLVEPLESTPVQQENRKSLSLSEKNLLSLRVYDKENRHTKTVKIDILIIIKPIHNYKISGLDHLLVNRKSRYLLEFQEQRDEQRDQCQIYYEWSVVGDLDVPHLQVKSDEQKEGINVTAIDGPDAGKEAQSIIVCVLRNNYGKQIGKVTKIVRVIREEDARIFLTEGLSSEYESQRHGENKYTITNEQLLLIPPSSGLKLPEHTKAEELSPCDPSPILLSSDKRWILTQDANPSPQVLKIYSDRHSEKSTLPIFTNVLVTEVCGVYVENYNGGLMVSPSYNAEGRSRNSNQLSTKIILIDCLGRAFPEFKRLKDIQIKVASHDSETADAFVNRETGRLEVYGKKIGKTHITVEVEIDGSLKAKDIIPVSVNVFIVPSSPISVHSGARIKFSVPQGLDTHTKDNNWSSSDQSIVKINPKTGQAEAYRVGTALITYKKSMQTQVNVVRLVDLDQVDQPSSSVYSFQPVYSGTVVEESFREGDESIVDTGVVWKCKVNGVLGQYFGCQVQGLKGSLTPEKRVLCKITPLKKVGQKLSPHEKKVHLTITAENPDISFFLKEEFKGGELSEIVAILTKHEINPREEESPYHIIIDTKHKLDVFQVGGRDECILGNQFNGQNQVVVVDLHGCRERQWSINVRNKRTGDMESIKIVSDSGDKGKAREEDSWKWTDILVILMAVNFAGICVYQYVQNSNAGTTY